MRWNSETNGFKIGENSKNLKYGVHAIIIPYTAVKIYSKIKDNELLHHARRILNGYYAYYGFCTGYMIKKKLKRTQPEVYH